tara:strand:- start:43 stop:225 length:183 start_codon:yes stop_codon:yes gene_type:complete
MTKYYKHIETFHGVLRTNFYQPDIAGTNICIPPNSPDNSDYARMMEEVAAGTSTIEEVED